MVSKLFIVAAALGLIVSLISDVMMFNQNRAAVVTGERVRQGYYASQAIDSVRIAILEYRLNKSGGVQLETALQSLKSQTFVQPQQVALIEQLADLTLKDMTETKLANALETLSAVEASLDSEIQHQVREDEKSSALAISRARYANVFDIFLILVFVTFFIYERKNALKIQSTMAKTLLDVETNNKNLRHSLAQKKSQLKTTVHDLKNPLGSIRGFAELISDDAGNRDSIFEMAKVIQRVSNNSLNLVSELLKDENGETTNDEPVRIFESLEESCLFLRPIANQKKQKIKLQISGEDLTLQGSKFQVQDVFLNAIGNALKFSPQGSTVIVRATSDRFSREIRIIDAGPGFKIEDFSKLFQQGATLSAKPTGNEVSTGLGLYSVKQTLDKMGGSIHIKNNDTVGASVIIRFPTPDLKLSTTGADEGSSALS